MLGWALLTGLCCHHQNHLSSCPKAPCPAPRLRSPPSTPSGPVPSRLGRHMPLLLTSNLLPDIKNTPLGSTARQVTASRWATMECTHFPEGRGRRVTVHGRPHPGRWGLERVLRASNVDARGSVSEPGRPASHKHSELGGQEGRASPVRLSRKRMPLSSWAVMVRGWFG